ncbi:MAG TPA: Uma2 family endonuclease [Chthonomonadaceae bacterium]|nr:Uma2 family endonuclease [Chthonomonadaceae bacterium]
MALPVQFEKDRYSEDEYFDFEQSSFGRWEYVNGEIRAVAGGTDDHNTILGNVGTALRVALSGKACRVYFAEMKLHTCDGINTFPDVAVVCGPRQYYRNRKDVVTNPILIAEVLSDSTAGYDRGDKFDHYKTIAALQDYLMVFQDKPHVILNTRGGDGWIERDYVGLESVVPLPSLGVELALADVYEQIEFDGAS